MHRKRTFRLPRVTAALLGLGLIATAAYAAVTFDPETGTGFVGKGDVQEPFGWNNKQLQDNASDVGFSFTDQATYSITCQTTAGPVTVTNTFFRVRNVNREVTYEARTQKQISGFKLLEYGVSSESGAPLTCQSGTLIAGPTLVSTSGGELSATHGGDSHVIWTAP